MRQQQAAAKLSKLAPAGSEGASRAAWWIVCSLVLQARAGLLRQDARGNPVTSGGLPPEKLMQLAESMAARQAAAAAGAAGQSKAAAAKAATAAGWTYEALLLHLDILQGQGKATEALQVHMWEWGEGRAAVAAAVWLLQWLPMWECLPAGGCLQAEQLSTAANAFCSG